MFKRLFFFFLLTVAACVTSCDFFDDIACDAALDTPMVLVSSDKSGLGYDFYMDVFEASRANAGVDSAGNDITDACSYKNTVPWSNVIFLDALEACDSAGKRLCTKEEWLSACQLGGVYPYGDSYEASACNASKTIATSGKYASCKNPLGIYDLSGNVKELVTVGTNRLAVLGGAYNSTEAELSCTAKSTESYDVTTYSAQPSVGFRCCRDVSI